MPTAAPRPCSRCGIAGCTIHNKLAKVKVVYGLPASGKTTFVQSTRQRGDLVVDLDFLFAALSALPLRDKPDSLFPFVLEARNAIYNRLTRECDVPTAWIITTDDIAAIHLVNRFQGELIELRVEESVRIQRLRDRELEVKPWP